MPEPPVVVDTNVLIAALLTSNPSSPVCQVLDGMLSRRFDFLLSEALLLEYRQVLLRKKIRDRHGLTPDEVDNVLKEIVANAIMRDPIPASSAPDPGDDHLWNLLASQKDGVLVTGDQRLIDNSPPQRRVLNPRDFCNSLSHP